MMLNQEAIVARLDRMEAAMARFDSREIIPLEDNAQPGPGAENRGPSKTI